MNRDFSPSTVTRLLISSRMTTIHIYGLDLSALAGPHSKSLRPILLNAIVLFYLMQKIDFSNLGKVDISW